MRNVIFISHATPEDNEFSIWLASRLELMGYEVWLDKNEFLGGEKMWQEIDLLIRNKAVKFLLVYSKHICTDAKPGCLKDGISKEYNFAESTGKNEHITDYIILLNVDNSRHDLFIGSDRLMQIPFHENWADGLKQLVNKLIKDKVSEQKNNSQSAISDWYVNSCILKNDIFQKKELYYSNWWAIEKLPEYFYIYQLKTEHEAKILNRQKIPYPIAKIGNCLSSFDPNLSLLVDHDGRKFELPLKSKQKIKISDVLSGVEKAAFSVPNENANCLKWLLNICFEQIMQGQELSCCEMATRTKAYFYTTQNKASNRIEILYQFDDDTRKKTKSLVGDYLSIGKWHYAVSSRPVLLPFLAFNLRSHLVFTKDGINLLDDTDKMHSYRRTKGKWFFNDEWRDMLIAFLHGLRKSDGAINLPLNKQFSLNMKPWTKSYRADFGYNEPGSTESLTALIKGDEFDIDNNEIEGDNINN